MLDLIVFAHATVIMTIFFSNLWVCVLVYFLCCFKFFFSPNSTSKVICSGRGECVCGSCECFQRRAQSAQKYSGEYCHCDDYSCSFDNNLLCGGKFSIFTVFEELLFSDFFTGAFIVVYAIPRLVI